MTFIDGASHKTSQRRIAQVYNWTQRMHHVTVLFDVVTTGYTENLYDLLRQTHNSVG